MVKWTSSKGKLLAEQVKQALKSGTWGDIFAPDFDLDNFEMSDLKQSNPEWDASFSTKQFRENVGRMIGKMISDNDGADEEAADIGLGPRRRRGDGTAPMYTEMDGAFDDLNLGNDTITVMWPIVTTVHRDTFTDDMYAEGMVGPVPNGPYYISIEGKDVVIKLEVEAMRYNPVNWIQAFAHENTLQGGARLAAFTENGIAVMGENEANPGLIVDDTRYTMDFDIEPNFFSRTPVPAHYEFRSPLGNRYIHFTVLRKRTNQYKANADATNVGHGGHVPHAPPQQQPQGPHAGPPPFAAAQAGPPPPPQHFNRQPPPQQQHFYHQAPPPQQQQQQHFYHQAPPPQQPAPFMSSQNGPSQQQQQQPANQPFVQQQPDPNNMGGNGYASKPPADASMSSPKKPPAMPTKKNASSVFGGLFSGGSSNGSSKVKSPPNKYFAGMSATVTAASTQSPASTVSVSL